MLVLGHNEIMFVRAEGGGSEGEGRREGGRARGREGKGGREREGEEGREIGWREGNYLVSKICHAVL